jgi:hypothetical protein
MIVQVYSSGDSAADSLPSSSGSRPRLPNVVLVSGLARTATSVLNSSSGLSSGLSSALSSCLSTGRSPWSCSLIFPQPPREGS